MPKHCLPALLLVLLFLQRLPAQTLPADPRSELSLLVSAAPSRVLLSQTPALAIPASPILDNYLRIGLDSNLALHQRNFDLQRSLLDLKRARAQFEPQAGFSSQYTLADGGRTQSIPVGDLLNGVYSTLNQLTGTNKFPQVANQSVQFLPNNFQDTKMEITLPILNTDLQYNKAVNSEIINSRKADVDIYRRDLIHTIRQAYYQYLQTEKAVDVYSNALLNVKANLRVSEKFVENNMATRESVFRAQSQVSHVESSLIEAGNDRRNAAAYVNFLLNRPLDTPVLTDSALLTDDTPAGPRTKLPLLGSTDTPSNPDTKLPLPSSAVPTASSSNGLSSAIAGREELSRLKSTQNILASNLRWNQNYLIPKLNAFYDIGFQGFGYHFNGAQFYQLAGVNLTWNLFKAGDNKYKISQARIDIRSTDEQYRQLTDQLTLEQQTTVNNYASTVEALHALADEVRSARETYRLADKRYSEGNALQIELIDSRTQMTDAEIRLTLGRLAVLNRAADLERVEAAYQFLNSK
jgi:outer membrane protein